MKYVGMTTRPAERKQEWEQQKGQSLPTFQVIRSGLTYDEAQTLESGRISALCDRCKESESHPGGPRKEGRVYSVYTYDY